MELLVKVPSIFAWCLVLTDFVAFISAREACKDRAPLGMKNGYIKSSQLSASSYLISGTPYTPAQARLQLTTGWCTSRPSRRPETQDWFQVTFNKLTTINGIATQGHPFYTFYIKSFKLELSTDVSGPFVSYNHGQIFAGNTNKNGIKYNWFNESLVARRLKIVPISINVRSALRMELYGCLEDEEKQLLPLGMQTGIIPNSRLAGNGYFRYNARLFRRAIGMYNLGRRSLYLVVDLVNPMTLTGIAMQGCLHSSYCDHNVVRKYSLLIRNNTASKYIRLGQIFNGNSPFSTDPVMSVLSTPVTARYVKISKDEASYSRYMKVELYGHKPICSGIVRSIDTTHAFTKILPAIHSSIAWCLPTNEHFLSIKFKKTVIITGILLQGDPVHRNWVKRFRFSYGMNKSELITDNKEYIGNSDQHDPLAIHWLTSAVIANHINIKPIQCQRACCFRFDIRGCDEVHFTPHSLQIQASEQKLTFSWKEPSVAITTVEKFVIRLEAFKTYNDSFGYIATFDTYEPTLTITTPFAAAHFNVSVFAQIDKNFTGIFEQDRIVQSFVQEPTAPPAPVVTSEDLSIKGDMTKIIKIHTVTDLFGPISAYQIIISTLQLKKEKLDNMYLLSQNTANAFKMSYFLGANIIANSSVNMYNMTLVEGEERSTDFNGRLNTIAIYHFYVRAVIVGKDAAKHKFKNRNIYGKSTHVIIERRSLPKLSRPHPSNATSMLLQLQRGPANTKYYQVVIMKLKPGTTKLQLNASSSYNVFKTYSSAQYNEPYITAVFDGKDFEKYQMFAIGDGAIYTQDSQNVRKKRSTTEFVNGPLKLGETFVMFQRISISNSFVTTPWSEPVYIDPPVNGNWSSWGDWTTCSQSCGMGMKRRKRICNSPVPKHDGSNCVTLTNKTALNETEIVSCTMKECPVNGQWGSWRNWTLCTSTCSGGIQERRRFCDSPSARHGGLLCLLPDFKIRGTHEMQSKVCNSKPCPVDGNWSPWTLWSMCSAQSGCGFRIRTRSCTSPPPSNEGEMCLANDVRMGYEKDVRTCYKFSPKDNTTWSLWSPWTACSVTCENGNRRRTRKCHGDNCITTDGDVSNVETLTEVCSLQPCPVHGQWSTWTHWGECMAATCTESRETRYRLCDDPLPRNNGSLCITKNNYSKIYEVESRSCTSQTCQQRLRGEGDKSSKKLSTLEFLLTLFGGCLIGIILLAIVMQIAKCRRNKKDSLVLQEVIQGVDNIALSDTNVSSNNSKNITTSGVVVNNNSDIYKENSQ